MADRRPPYQHPPQQVHLALDSGPAIQRAKIANAIMPEFRKRIREHADQVATHSRLTNREKVAKRRRDSGGGPKKHLEHANKVGRTLVEELGSSGACGPWDPVLRRVVATGNNPMLDGMINPQLDHFLTVFPLPSPSGKYKASSNAKGIYEVAVAANALDEDPLTMSYEDLQPYIQRSSSTKLAEHLEKGFRDLGRSVRNVDGSQQQIVQLESGKFFNPVNPMLTGAAQAVKKQVAKDKAKAVKSDPESRELKPTGPPAVLIFAIGQVFRHQVSLVVGNSTSADKRVRSRFIDGRPKEGPAGGSTTSDYNTVCRMAAAIHALLETPFGPMRTAEATEFGRTCRKAFLLAKFRGRLGYSPIVSALSLDMSLGLTSTSTRSPPSSDLLVRITRSIGKPKITCKKPVKVLSDPCIIPAELVEFFVGAQALAMAVGNFGVGSSGVRPKGEGKSAYKDGEYGIDTDGLGEILRVYALITGYMARVRIGIEAVAIENAYQGMQALIEAIRRRFGHTERSYTMEDTYGNPERSKDVPGLGLPRDRVPLSRVTLYDQALAERIPAAERDGTHDLAGDDELVSASSARIAEFDAREKMLPQMDTEIDRLNDAILNPDTALNIKAHEEIRRDLVQLARNALDNLMADAPDDDGIEAAHEDAVRRCKHASWRSMHKLLYDNQFVRFLDRVDLGCSDELMDRIRESFTVPAPPPDDAA